MPIGYINPNYNGAALSLSVIQVKCEGFWIYKGSMFPPNGGMAVARKAVGWYNSKPQRVSVGVVQLKCEGFEL